MNNNMNNLPPHGPAPNITLHTHGTTSNNAVRRLKEAIGNSQEVLLTANTVFPFTLFPDTVTVDREKISIAHRFFFRVAEVVSMRIEDILNVTADVGPIFGSISVLTRFFDPDKPYIVNYLWREDALRLKRILQGYVIAVQKGIDLSTFSAEELAMLLNEFGQGSPSRDM
jgi:hypothetical protein